MSEGSKHKALRRTLLVWNAANALGWGVLIYPSVTVWRHSIPWLAFMSAWANFAAGLAALTASLVHRDQADTS